MNSRLERKRDFVSTQRRQSDAIIRGKPESSQHDFRAEQEIIHPDRVRKMFRHHFDAFVYVRLAVVLQLWVDVKPTVLVKARAVRGDRIFNRRGQRVRIRPVISARDD